MIAGAGVACAAITAVLKRAAAAEASARHDAAVTAVEARAAEAERKLAAALEQARQT